MRSRRLTLLLVVLAVGVAALAMWGAIALPTGHHHVVECLRPDRGCVGPEDFRYPVRIAILIGGALVSGLLLRKAV